MAIEIAPYYCCLSEPSFSWMMSCTSVKPIHVCHGSCRLLLLECMQQRHCTVCMAVAITDCVCACVCTCTLTHTHTHTRILSLPTNPTCAIRTAPVDVGGSVRSFGSGGYGWMQDLSQKLTTAQLMEAAGAPGRLLRRLTERVQTKRKKRARGDVTPQPQSKAVEVRRWSFI